MPTISIIIPVYGVERYIEACAISLFKQTYHELEYIFVNDCTKDRSIDILREVVNRFPERKSAVHIVEMAKNSGQSWARKVGIEHSKGEYLMFVDSDDTLPLDACETLMQKANSNNANGNNTDINNVNSNDADIIIDGHDIPPCYRERYAACLLAQAHVNHTLWGKLFRKHVILDNYWIEGLNIGEDYLALTKAALLSTKIAFVEKNTYFYRIEDRGYKQSQIDQVERAMIEVEKAMIEVERQMEKLHKRVPQMRRFLELGFLSLVREAAIHHLTTTHLYQRLSSFNKLLFVLFQHKATFPLANLMFKAHRNYSINHYGKAFTNSLIRL